jgi:CRISPR-associated protein Cas1
MTNRVIDISDSALRLCVRNSQLVIRPPGASAGPSINEIEPAGSEREAHRCERLGKPSEQTVPLAEIAALIISNPQVSLTHAVLSELAAAGGIFIACDRKHMPAAMLLPLAAHSLQSEKFAAQAAAPLPLKKRLWRQIVKAKIRAQAHLLAEITGSDHGLWSLAARVRSGDPDNVEARAARVYWPNLFGPARFRRDPDEDGANALLNYGYAVLRAITARALCGAGLHPGLGLHHHNRYDAFPLADDVMEPFRPLADRAVVSLMHRGLARPTLDADAKRAILQPLVGRFAGNGESRTLFDWVGRTASSLATAIETGRPELEIPALEPAAEPGPEEEGRAAPLPLPDDVPG